MEGFNWSFSGLKTQVLHFLKREQAADPTFVQRHKADICASVQAAIPHVAAPLMDADSSWASKRWPMP